MTRILIALAVAASLLAGCASAPAERDTEARSQPPQYMEFPGVVEGVREIEIDTERGGTAPMLGAMVGGVAGSSAGRGKGAAVGGVVGTVVGAVAGETVAQSGKQGVEITVKLDDGRVIAVTQPAGKEAFTPGERVRVQSDGHTARVTR